MTVFVNTPCSVCERTTLGVVVKDDVYICVWCLEGGEYDD